MGIKRQQPDHGKFRPTQSNSRSPETDFPSISLRYTNPNYCLTKCDKDEQAAFANQIYSLTRMTWAQISTSPRHGLGYEKIEQLKNLLPADAGDANAIAFRFSGKKAMVGFRQGGVLNVVWFDRDFTLYDHG